LNINPSNSTIRALYPDIATDQLDCSTSSITHYLILISKNYFYTTTSNTMAMAENIFNKFTEFIRDVRNDEIKSIVFGLFALIGFIILVYSIFTGIVREPLASVADTIFVAVIIGSFTLVGIIIGKRLLNK
jgi:hypothetical protein